MEFCLKSGGVPENVRYSGDDMPHRVALDFCNARLSNRTLSTIMYKRAAFQARLTRVRVQYDAAFKELCRAVCEHQTSIERGDDPARIRLAEQNVQSVRATCTRARNALAELLLERKFDSSRSVRPAMKPESPSPRPDYWKTVIVRIGRPQ